jgi:hypothetical protein
MAKIIKEMLTSTKLSISSNTPLCLQAHFQQELAIVRNAAEQLNNHIHLVDDRLTNTQVRFMNTA